MEVLWLLSGLNLKTTESQTQPDVNIGNFDISLAAKAYEWKLELHTVCVKQNKAAVGLKQCLQGLFIFMLKKLSCRIYGLLTEMDDC